MKFELNKTLRGLSDEEVLSDLRSAAKSLGKDSITGEEYSEIGMGNASSVHRRFGSWTKALSLAGLQPSRSRIGITEEELFENIRQVWITLGRQPLYSEVKKPISEYSAGTYDRRFGSWGKALETFVSWVSSDTIDSLEQKNEESHSELSAPKIHHRTKRNISDRMRFRILMRDGFTCRSCGSSPTKTRDIELHVDHVLPWSRGGETTEDNLETKCAKCNLGKGNAFIA